LKNALKIKTLDELKRFLTFLNIEEIKFVPYFYTKKKERPYITEDLIRNKLKSIKDILGFQRQVVKNKVRFRIGIRLSGRYTLVVVSEPKEKCLYIITAWKTSRKWQKQIQK